MTDELRASLTKSFLEFIADYGDPATVDKKEIERRCDCRIAELFSRQIHADRVKKKMGKDNFNSIIAAYLDKFNLKDGVDAFSLKKELNLNGHLLERHLGKTAVKYLDLLTQIYLMVDDKPKGLLSA